MFKKIAIATAASALVATAASANAAFYAGLGLNLMDHYNVDAEHSGSTTHLKNDKFNIALQGGVELDDMVGVPLRVGLTLSLPKTKEIDRTMSMTTGGASATTTSSTVKFDFKKKMSFDIDVDYLLPVGPGKVALGGYLSSSSWESVSKDLTPEAKIDGSHMTLGVHGGYIFPVSDMIDVEGGLKFGIYSNTKTTDDVDYKVKNDTRIYGAVNFKF